MEYGGGCSPIDVRSTRQRGLSLDAADDRRRLNGDDRQLSVWLDLLRPGYPEDVRMGPRVDPVGVHPVRAVRDLARADRGLVRRSPWAPRRGPARWAPVRDRLGDQCLRDLPDRLISGHDR